MDCYRVWIVIFAIAEAILMSTPIIRQELIASLRSQTLQQLAITME